VAAVRRTQRSLSVEVFVEELGDDDLDRQLQNHQRGRTAREGREEARVTYVMSPGRTRIPVSSWW
jgi:hypothetical protein